MYIHLLLMINDGSNRAVWYSCDNHIFVFQPVLYKFACLICKVYSETLCNHEPNFKLSMDRSLILCINLELAESIDLWSVIFACLDKS